MSQRFDCILCRCQSGSLEILAARDLYLGIPGAWDYYRCDGCGLVQQSPVPEDLSRFYATYPVHGQRGRFFHLMRRLMMPDVYYRIPIGERPLLLDYGCGNGDYLSSVRNRAEAVGFELSSDLAERVGRQLAIPVLSDLERVVDRYAGRLDVITMHCVVEHLPTPRIAFEIAAKLLRQGGLFYAVLPHYDSWDRRRFGRYWHSLDAPRHVSFPDVAHFRTLAAEFGMTLKGHRDVCFPNNLAGSISTRLFGKFSWPTTAALLPAAWLTQRFHPTGTRAFWMTR